MFCPRCGIENSLEQSYCRQCGQPLSNVRHTLEGHVDEMITCLRKGQKLLCVSSLALSIFFLIALASYLTKGLVGFANAFSMLIFLAGILLLFIVGMMFTGRANRLLNVRDEKGRPTFDGVRLVNSPSADSIGNMPTAQRAVPVSVAENSTLKLNPPERSR